jgi:peptidoglycan/LPS O-acetylase OafA/YrhL
LVAAVSALSLALHLFQNDIFDFSILALFFGSLVWLGLQRKLAIFNSRIFYWLSRLSFGMYLNHEYMCPWIVNTILPRLPFSGFRILSNLAGLAIAVTFSAAIALVTFCCVEHPFLQMRKIVLGRKSTQPASIDLAPAQR